MTAKAIKFEVEAILNEIGQIDPIDPFGTH
jgi:hypothetical protein